MSAHFDSISDKLASDETEVHFVVNAEYADRVAVLFEQSKKGTKATPESFFRSLQILAHLAGSPMRWDPD